MTEWRDVPGYSGLYLVSSDGEVKGIKRGKVLSTRPNPEGYARAALSKNGVYAHLLVNRIVCEAFHGPPPVGKPLALHDNGDPSDNRSSNLHWGDNSENMLDRRRHGTDFHVNKTECVNGHQYTPENTYINAEGHRSCKTCRQNHTNASRTRKQERGQAA